jgi:hypothetical protein
LKNVFEKLTQCLKEFYTFGVSIFEKHLREDLDRVFTLTGFIRCPKSGVTGE